MAFTYGGDPANSTLEAIRFALGDTDSNDYELEDAEINYALGIQSDPRLAAAALAGNIAALYARRPDQRVGQTSVTYSQVAEHWEKIRKGLLDGSISIFTGEDGSGHAHDMTIGGVSKDEREDLLSDSDNIGIGLDDDEFLDGSRFTWGVDDR